MDKLILIASIFWFILTIFLVIATWKDKSCQNRDVTYKRLGKQIIYSLLSASCLVVMQYRLAGIFMSVSAMLITLAIQISDRNKKKFLSSLG